MNYFTCTAGGAVDEILNRVSYINDNEGKLNFTPLVTAVHVVPTRLNTECEHLKCFQIPIRHFPRSSQKQSKHGVRWSRAISLVLHFISFFEAVFKEGWSNHTSVIITESQVDKRTSMPLQGILLPGAPPNALSIALWNTKGLFYLLHQICSK